MVAALLRRRRGGSGFGYLAANGYTPSLAADFVRGRYAYAVAHAGGYRPQRCDFADLFTHSHSGNATMVGADGTLQWAPHNLLTRSEEFDHSSWNALSGALVHTANQAVAPDGSLTADEITLSSNFIAQFYSTAAGLGYTFGLWVRSASGEVSVQLREINGSGQETVTVGEEWELHALTVTSSSASTYWGIDQRSGGASTSGTIYIWGAHLYRSDLGGMASVPPEERGLSTSATYLPTTSAARYLPRTDNHVYDGSSWVNKGLLIEKDGATNLDANSEDWTDWTLGGSTTGEQTATLSNGVNGIGVNTSDGDYEAYAVYDSSNAAFIVARTVFDSASVTGRSQRQHVTFTTPAGCNFIRFYPLRVNSTANVYDDVAVSPSTTYTASFFHEKDATQNFAGGLQLEEGSVPSSYIPTNGATASRAAETLTIDSSLLPYSSTAMSIAMRGAVTYSDNNVAAEVIPHLWEVDVNNRIRAYFQTSGGDTGQVIFDQKLSGTTDFVAGSATDYSPGVNVAFSIASRHEDGSINGAVGGTALTADDTPTALPDLSATDLDLAYDFNGNISRFLMWGESIGDDGIESSSA